MCQQPVIIMIKPAEIGTIYGCYSW